MDKDVWKDRGWIRGNQIEGGNQGHTFLARKVDDPSDQFSYVLKKLKRQKDLDRRASFCAEVLATRVLDHYGVVKIADSNAIDFRDDVELFIVTERIVGADLESLIGINTLSLFDAAKVVVGVMDVVDHCHRRGVIHRDIKPCHVIFRDDKLTQPVLIDFGIAYLEEQPVEAATKEGVGKGNRFLVGPEHLSGSIGNRNPVTDVCQCIGLLFFAITGKEPGVLRDTENKMPHERLALASLISSEPKWKQEIVFELFTTGFAWEPKNRWQTIGRVVDRLQSLLSSRPPSNEAFGEKLTSLMTRAESLSITPSILEEASKMAKKIFELMSSVVEVAKAPTKSFLTLDAGGAGTNSAAGGKGFIGALGLGGSFGELGINIVHNLDGTKTKTIQLVCSINEMGDVEVVLKPFNGNLSIFKDSKPLTLGVFSVGSGEYIDELRELFEENLQKCIEETLGV